MLRLQAFFLSILICCIALPASKLAASEDIGRLICTGFYGRTAKDRSVQTLKSQIQSKTVGCVILYGHNIQGPRQLQGLIRYLKTDAPFPLLVAIDQEGGQVQRLTSTKHFMETPSPRWMARHMSPRDAYRMYRRMARQLADLGINVNFGVIVDLDYENSPIISDLERSYSSNPGVALEYAEAMIDAHRDEGVIACIKHFPGHGSVGVDPHHIKADISQSWGRQELYPFSRLIRGGKADMIMTAHIQDKRRDAAYPASLSKVFIRDMLRKDLSYHGVVISDDLMMKAVSLPYSLDERIVQAVNSGSDLLLFGALPAKDKRFVSRVHETLAKAVSDGRIPKKRIRESLDRISALSH